MISKSLTRIYLENSDQELVPSLFLSLSLLYNAWVLPRLTGRLSPQSFFLQFVLLEGSLLVIWIVKEVHWDFWVLCCGTDYDPAEHAYMNEPPSLTELFNPRPELVLPSWRNSIKLLLYSPAPGMPSSSPNDSTVLQRQDQSVHCQSALLRVSTSHVSTWPKEEEWGKSFNRVRLLGFQSQFHNLWP